MVVRDERSVRAEDDYFRRRDAELVERARLDRQRESEREALAQALGLTEPAMVEALHREGLRAESVRLLELVPAVEVAGIDGVDAAERKRLVRELAQASPDQQAERLVQDWLDRRPHADFFAAAIGGLRAQLSSLATEGERAALRRRVVDASTAVARSSGGLLGVGALSASEQRRIDRLEAELDEAAGTR
ncbi:MAG: hypothetical protein AB7I50_05395 [Vicinamibacterales bacterium]